MEINAACAANAMLTAKEYAVVAQSVLFRDVPSDGLPALLDSRCAVVTAAKGETVSCTPPGMRLLLRGCASVRTRSTDGAELRELQPGDVFGVAQAFADPVAACEALADSAPISWITTLTDCRILVMSRDSLWSLLLENPQVLQNYLRFLSDRIIFLNARLRRYTTSDNAARLASFLYAQRAAGDDGWAVTVSNMSRLAEQLGMTRVTLYRALDTLTEAGLVSRNGRSILLHDPEALRAYAGA